MTRSHTVIRFYSVVYFVRRLDGLVKIGCSTALPLRLATLAGQYGPLELLGLQYGGLGEEHALHRIFKEFRVEGEWFEFLGDLREYVSELDGECDHLVQRLPPHVQRRVTVQVRKYRRKVDKAYTAVGWQPSHRQATGGQMPISADIVDAIRALEAEGFGLRPTARKLGVSTATVAKYRASSPPVDISLPAKVRDPATGVTRVTDHARTSVIELSAGGMSLRQVGDYVGLSPSTVANILRRHQQPEHLNPETSEP